MNIKAYIHTCMLLIVLPGIVHPLFSQNSHPTIQAPVDSIQADHPARTTFVPTSDSLQASVQTRACVSTFTNQTVSSYLYVSGCNTLVTQNITVTGSGNLSLAAPGDITINGPFDVLLGGQLNVNSEQPGNTRQSSIDMGIYSAPFQFSDSKNTANYSNEYAGQPGNDVFYRFTLSVPMRVTIQHCGSFGDTYLHLLDANGTRIAYNDDYSGAGACSNAAQSYLKLSLAAGTYYIVSEGYNSNGIIQTSVTGEIMQSSFGYTYDASGNRIARQIGSAMSSVVPTTDAEGVKETGKLMEGETQVDETYESGTAKHDLLH